MDEHFLIIYRIYNQALENFFFYVIRIACESPIYSSFIDWFILKTQRLLL